MTTTTNSNLSPAQDRTDPWANLLPGDLLASVFQLLSVPSRICFRAVCRSWRAAVSEQDHRAERMPPPWVVIPHSSGCSKSFTLISIPTMHSFQWAPPGGVGLRCVGSGGGWLAGAYIDADRKKRVALVNPLTETRVEVPVPVGRVLSPIIPKHGNSQLEEITLSGAVQKVAFAPNPTQHDFAVAVVTRLPNHGRYGKAVAFARAGGREDGWCAFAELPDERSRYGSQLDVAYHDGKFYYVTTCRQVWVVDMAAADPTPTPLARFEPTITHGHSACYYPSGNGNHHLAFSSDGALHVVWIPTNAHTKDCFNMLVQRYDGPRSASSSQANGASSPWTEATRLHGQAFLVGDFNQTLCVPVDGDEGAGLRPHSVYFTNIHLCSLLAKLLHPQGAQQHGVWLFDLATRDIGRTFYFPNTCRPLGGFKRQTVDFRRPAWSKDDDDRRVSEPQETWNYLSGLRLDWSTAIWFMPSMQ
ncbi:hypothetical protein QOZ80_1BG0056360 [Eleusine coracana subsp. coracana]|nr:hypothetical protein QOZ80_1BG0056360 [Eleusine coracana subsp. coracana]